MADPAFDYVVSLRSVFVKTNRGGGAECFEVNILRLNFHEINNCLKDML